MIPGTLARRYARALLGLAKTASVRDKLADDIDQFAALVRQKDTAGMPLLAVLTADRYPLAQRRQLLERLAQTIEADAITRKFLTYVLERGRMQGILEIARAFRRMADDAAGRVRARITSAHPLAPDAVMRVQRALEKATGKQVVAETAVDPELLGGLVTQIGSFLLDGSVKTALEQLRVSLRKA